MQNHFIITVPVFNAGDYIDKCIESILYQDYDNYSAVIVDDCSKDDTWDIILEYSILDNFKVYRNEIHNGSPLENTKKGIEIASLNREDIIIVLDGDDWFAHGGVLTKLNEVYQEDIWMTYGQFEPLSKTYFNFSKPIENTKTYRKSGQWHTSAPRTFRRWLWNKINPDDMKYKGGFACHASDRAYLYPMIEMAGKHCRFIPEVLYIYNDLSPDNFFKNNPAGCMEEALHFINKPIYNEL